MKKAVALALLVGICAASISRAEKPAPAGGNKRMNPPGTFLSPGYYIPRAFDGETPTIACSDGYKLAGDLVKKKKLPRAGSPAILFLHEAGKDRKSWYPLTIQLAGRGFLTLAVDLRGCGENPRQNGDEKKTLAKLPEAEQQKMLEDVRNALSFLSMASGADQEKIGIIGSGLGANLALAAAAEPWARGVKIVIAISPSLDDRGYNAGEAAKKTGKTLVCLAASRGDTTSYRDSSSLFALLTGPKDFFEAEGNATGTALFGAKPAAPANDAAKDQVLFAHLQIWANRGLMMKPAELPPVRKPANR